MDKIKSTDLCSVCGMHALYAVANPSSRNKVYCGEHLPWIYNPKRLPANVTLMDDLRTADYDKKVEEDKAPKKAPKKEEVVEVPAEPVAEPVAESNEN
jgi:hypothetical protein